MDLKRYGDRALDNQLKAAKSKDSDESKAYVKLIESDMDRRNGAPDRHAVKKIEPK